MQKFGDLSHDITVRFLFFRPAVQGVPLYNSYTIIKFWSEIRTAVQSLKGLRPKEVFFPCLISKGLNLIPIKVLHSQANHCCPDNSQVHKIQTRARISRARVRPLTGTRKQIPRARALLATPPPVAAAGTETGSSTNYRLWYSRRTTA